MSQAARSRKTGHKSVTLVVLPYNYPRLWPLLDELINTHRNIPNIKWRKVNRPFSLPFCAPLMSSSSPLPKSPRASQEFESYLARTPPYYYPYLRVAFKRYSFPVQEHIEDGYTLAVNTHLQKIKLLAQVFSRRFASFFLLFSSLFASAKL